MFWLDYSNLRRKPGRLLNRLHYTAHWRCREPVVVFESDDWGLERRACSEFLRAWGEPGEWADEERETPEDLFRLYEVLELYRDPFGRPACFTANFVVANPDFNAIERDDFARYSDIPIDQLDGLPQAWREGLEQRVFFPQYHGRAHFWPERWLEDLRANAPGAREMFARHCHGGLSLMNGQNWRYHSEYFDWHSGRERSGEELHLWLGEGLKVFKRTFGYSPRSVIMPHYLLTPRSARSWRAHGGEFVQGTDYRILRRADGLPCIISHVLGEQSSDGLLLLRRNVKFDPRPQRPDMGVDQAIRNIELSLSSRVPAVVDTHRINYTGLCRDEGLEALAILLRALKFYRARILTTVELAEAITQNGDYRDVWTGEARRLTPLDPFWRRGLRARFETGAARTIAKTVDHGAE